VKVYAQAYPGLTAAWKYEVGMEARRFMRYIVLLTGWLGIQGVAPASAESTIRCPAGTYDMLDAMSLDSNLRTIDYLTGSANPLFTEMPGKVLATGTSGCTIDVTSVSRITEYACNLPNEPLAPGCTKLGFRVPRSKVPNTTF
jgi:hypothetical protein